MKKVSVKFRILLLIAALCLVAPLFFCAVGTEENIARADSDNPAYSFDGVDARIEVRKDKTFKITERLTVEWHRTQSGFIRDIQRLSRTTRIINGGKKKGKRYIAGISEVSATLNGGECDWWFIPKTDDFYLPDFYSIEMKKPEGRYAAGERSSFELSYIYDMSDDKARGFDDFTFDVLGYAMEASQEFTAEIIFPEEVDEGSFSVRSNYGSTSYVTEWEPEEALGEKLEITGNTVKITAKPMRKGKGYTVQYILPDGYFTTGGVTFYWYYVAFAVLAFAAVAAGLILFFINLPKKPLKTVEFYPPEDVSLMRFSSVYHRGARMKDCSALILKWAAEGLISIEPDGNNNVILREVEATDEDKPKKRLPAKERAFFDKMFSGLSGTPAGSFSTREFKKYAFTAKGEKLCSAARGIVGSADNPHPVDKKKLTRSKIIMAALSVVPMIFMMIYVAILTDGWMALFALPFMAAGTAVPLIFSRSSGFPIWMYLIIIPFSFAFCLMPYWALFLGQYANIVYDYLNLALILPVWWIIANYVLILFPFMGARTASAQATYGKICGFKQFILYAELPRIQLMFDENPDYFSEILPYCFIMGVSEKVKKRFAALDISLPLTYGGVNESTVTRCFTASLLMSSVGYAAAHGGGGGGSSGGGGGGSSGGGGGGGGSRSR